MREAHLKHSEEEVLYSAQAFAKNQIIGQNKFILRWQSRVRLKVMRECKACLARACAGKASLALPA
jgi:hypothetical protein